MKPKIYYNHWLPKRLGMKGITIYPYIFISTDPFYTDDRLIKHELVHIGQVEKYGWWRFYISYLLEFLAHYIRLGNWDAAYMKIDCEIEAYNKQEWPDG